MNKDKIKISNYRRLNDIILTIEKKERIVEVPRDTVQARNFTVSIPYHIKDDKITFPRTIGPRSGRYKFDSLNKEDIPSLVETYLNYTVGNFVDSVVYVAKTAIYKNPKPALVGSPLNAFVAIGVVYTKIQKESIDAKVK